MVSGEIPGKPYQTTPLAMRAIREVASLTMLDGKYAGFVGQVVPPLFL
jgi:hypothetical protein